MITDPQSTKFASAVKSHPSDSTPQGKVERGILERLSAEHPEWQLLDLSLAAAELGLSLVWQKAKPDAVWRIGPDELIVAECYARVGALKSGHRRKLAMDALKLMALRYQCPDAKRLKCLIIVPQEIQEQLKGKSWLCAAMNIAADLMPVVLSDDERELLADTTRRQADGQARSRKPEKTRHPE